MNGQLAAGMFAGLMRLAVFVLIPVLIMVVFTGDNGGDYERYVPETIQKMKDDGQIKQAERDEYQKWFRGYVKAGGSPTHRYDYKFPKDRFFVAQKDFNLGPLYASDAVHIIVPEGIKIVSGKLGQNNHYFMEGYEHKGRWVPRYTNINPN